MTDKNRPTGLPRTTYEFPTRFEEYIRAQLGITVGHQGWDNNILMAESFMKLLPQVLIARKEELLKNQFTKKETNIVIDKTALFRVNQIWSKGLHVLILRDENNPNIILDRIVAYRFPYDSVQVSINGDLGLYHNVWDVQKLCKHCKSNMFALISEKDLMKFPQHGILCCSSCSFISEVEVETKPSLSMMRPVMKVETNPVWVWIRGSPKIRYAWEDLPLSALSSKQGGFYKEVQFGFNKVQLPRFTSKSEILNSQKPTSFPSQKYFQVTMQIEFGEWSFYFNKLMVQTFKLYKATKSPEFMETVQRTKRID